MNSAETFFEIGRKDLESAKLLFDNELYPQAVFFFQQSVEKVTKAFAILLKEIREDEVKEDIRHDPSKVFEKFAKKQKEKLEKLKKGIEKIPKLRETKLVVGLDLEKNLKSTDKFLKLFTELKSEEDYCFPKEEIKSLIKELHEIESQAKTFSKTFSITSISEDEIMNGKKVVEEVFDVFHEINPEKVEEAKQALNSFLSLDLMKDMIREFVKIIVDNIYIIYSLFILSLIITPNHAIATRYPVKEHNPLETYNKNHPLIELFDELVEIMEKTVSGMENLLKLKVN